MSFGSIHIEDGIIKNIGSSIITPANVEVVDVDSAYIYPAFIATISHAGIKNVEKEKKTDVARPGYPPNDVAGITPELSIATSYAHADNSIKAFREAGFAIAHTVPKGGMLPGKGSVVTLSGAPFDDSVIEQDMSLYAQFKGAERMFPATTIGVIAKWRELYKNAQIGHRYTMTYKANPSSKKRLQQDAATKGLYPVVSNKIPVFFHTESALDIFRALNLQSELGFNIFLSEVKSGQKATKKVKRSNQPILFSLDLPKEDETKEDELNDEQKVLLTKKKESILASYQQVSDYVSMDIPFSFSYIDVKPKDIHDQVKTLIDHGLKEEDALKAMTIDAAKALQIDNIVGSLERGKIANLVITTDTLFNDGNQIKTVFIDGIPHNLDIKTKKSNTIDPDVDFSGSYTYNIEIPGMMPSGKMTFVKNDDTYDILITSDQAEGETYNATDVIIDGNTIEYDFTIQQGGMTIPISNTITIDSGSFEGEVTIPDFGSFPITAEKIDSPE